MNGFKVLEAKYDESQRKLAVAEEQLSAVSASRSEFATQMEMATQILHDREMVRQHI